MKKVYLECWNNTSSKFYDLSVNKNTVSASYGRIGTKPRFIDKKFDSPSEAQSFFKKTLDKKLKEYKKAKPVNQQLRIIF